MKKVVTAFIACLIVCAILPQTAHAEYIGSTNSTLSTLTELEVKNPADDQIVTTSRLAVKESTEYVENTNSVDPAPVDSALDCAIWLTDSSGNLISELYPGQNYVVNIQFDAYADVDGVRVWLDANLLNSGILLSPGQGGFISCSWRTLDEPRSQRNYSVGLLGDAALRMRYAPKSGVMHTSYNGTFSVADEELFAIGVRLGGREKDGQMMREDSCRLQFGLETEPVYTATKPEDPMSEPVPSAPAEMTLTELNDKVNRLIRSTYDGLEFAENLTTRQVNSLRSELETQRRSDAKALIVVAILFLVVICWQRSRINSLQDKQAALSETSGKIWKLLNPGMYSDDEGLQSEGNADVTGEPGPKESLEPAPDLTAGDHLEEAKPDQISEPGQVSDSDQIPGPTTPQPQAYGDFALGDAHKTPLELIKEARQILENGDGCVLKDPEQLLAQLRQAISDLDIVLDGQRSPGGIIKVDPPANGAENPPADDSDTPIHAEDSADAD